MNKCYYCGEESTGSEHIPPRSFFPKGKRENLITVPSCDKHNSHKSDIDEYIKTILMGVSYDEIQDIGDFKKKPIRSLIRNKGSNLKKLFLNPKLEILNNKLTISSEIDTVKLDYFFKLFFKGIYHHEYKKIIDLDIVIIYHFLKDNFSNQSKEQIEKLEKLSIDDNKIGKNESTFYYTADSRVIDNKETVLIELNFYNNIKITGFLKEI